MNLRVTASGKFPVYIICKKYGFMILNDQILFLSLDDHRINCFAKMPLSDINQDDILLYLTYGKFLSTDITSLTYGLNQ